MEGAVSTMAMSNAILHDVVTKEKKRKLPPPKKTPHDYLESNYLESFRKQSQPKNLFIFLCINHEQSRREGRNNPICNSNS